MEVIRGRESDCGQEIRGQTRRGGTRSAHHIDPQRQGLGPVADEGSHPAEGGCLIGEGWSDSAIAAALDTGIATVERTRRQLVEEGFAAALKGKYNANS